MCTSGRLFRPAVNVQRYLPNCIGHAGRGRWMRALRVRRPRGDCTEESCPEASSTTVALPSPAMAAVWWWSRQPRQAEAQPTVLHNIAVKLPKRHSSASRTSYGCPAEPSPGRGGAPPCLALRWYLWTLQIQHSATGWTWHAAG